MRRYCPVKEAGAGAVLGAGKRTEGGAFPGGRRDLTGHCPVPLGAVRARTERRWNGATSGQRKGWVRTLGPGAERGLGSSRRTVQGKDKRKGASAAFVALEQPGLVGAKGWGQGRKAPESKTAAGTAAGTWMAH